VKKVTGSTSEIPHLLYDLSYKKGFKMPHRVPEINRIQQLMGYTSTVSLEAHPRTGCRGPARKPLS
jgi:hypothetical protein